MEERMNDKRCKHGVREPYRCRDCEHALGVFIQETGRLPTDSEATKLFDASVPTCETCGSDCRSLPHPDDAAVDRFAATMKWKLAKKRAEGRGGWDNPAVCSIDDLARMLVTHVAKSDPIDIANFAMMLWNRGETERGTFFGDAKTAVARSIKMAFLEGTVGKDRGDE